MSTPGPERVPSNVKVGKTSGQGKPPTGPAAAKKAGAAKPGARKPGAANPGGKGRRPVAAVKVTGGRNWVPIIVGIVVTVVVLGIVGAAGWFAFKSDSDKKDLAANWEKKALAIQGVVDYRSKYPELQQVANHKEGVLTYPVSPPVGGAHNPLWQNCMGNVYDAPIPKENAVHSLEHGAIWVTYKPGLDPAQVDILKKKVQGQEYMLMSPYTGLDSNISLQAWGFQLKLSDANDSRIDSFIKDLRLNTSKEPGAACSGGTSATGDTPVETPN